jgi:hypothetical protein
MDDPNPKPQPPDPDDALRALVLARATAINAKLLARLETAAEDLAEGGHRAALGSLDGIEREIDRMRSFLLLLS